MQTLLSPAEKMVILITYHSFSQEPWGWTETAGKTKTKNLWGYISKRIGAALLLWGHIITLWSYISDQIGAPLPSSPPQLGFCKIKSFFWHGFTLSSLTDIALRSRRRLHLLPPNFQLQRVQPNFPDFLSSNEISTLLRL